MKLLRQIPLALLCVSVACPSLWAQTPEKPESDTAKQSAPLDDSLYRKLVDRIKGGDLTVDFVQLRDSFGAWLCNEKVKTDAPNRAAMVSAFEKKDYAKAVELVEPVLDYEFVHIGLHRAAAEAYGNLGLAQKADFHKNIAEKLQKALLSSGDGKTPETAFRVLTVREEYVIMNELGYEVQMQALLAIKGKSYDRLSGKDKKTDQAVSVYFDISSFFGGCERVRK